MGVFLGVVGFFCCVFGNFGCFRVILSVFRCLKMKSYKLSVLGVFLVVFVCFCGSCKGVSRKFHGRFKKV